MRPMDHCMFLLHSLWQAMHFCAGVLMSPYLVFLPARVRKASGVRSSLEVPRTRRESQRHGSPVPCLHSVAWRGLVVYIQPCVGASLTGFIFQLERLALCRW